MKLQYKAWLLIVAAVILLTLLAVGVTSLALSKSLADLEQEEATQEGDRAKQLLDLQLQDLVATVKDYGYWDDTVLFVEGKDDAFLADNITVENLTTLRVAEVMVLDRRAQVRAAAHIVPGQGLVMTASPLRTLLVDQAGDVLADASGMKTTGTYVRQGGELYMVGVVAIRSPAKPNGSPVGALVMVRRFDHAELLRFSHVLMSSVSLHLLDEHEHAQKGAMIPISSSRAEIHAVIEDSAGRPIAELVQIMDRSIAQEASRIVLTTGAEVLLAGLMIGGLLVLLMDRWVLRRLNRMHDQLGQITAQGAEGDAQIRMGGQDELTVVAQGINALLQRVRHDAAVQREAHARQEELQLQLMQSQKMEAIGRFTGGIAHDINNSLAGISGWIRVAMEDLPSDHPGMEALDRALKGSSYAGGLMRQLLAFSRQTEPRLERLSMSDLIERARSLTAAGMLKRTEVVVTSDVDPSQDQVMADPTQLQQVLMNLLINASDAMAGEGRIHIVTERRLWSGNDDVHSLPGVAGLPVGEYLHVTVRDEGPGIAPEHLDRVFEPFFTTKDTGRGTGLGLSVAHGIMGRHRGSVGVSSRLGEGSTFHLMIPVATAVASGEPGEVQHAAGDQARRRILLVDDDDSLRHAWGRLLERKGWDVVRARDGEEAWLHFQHSTTPWDVVMSDLAMPHVDGRELATRILATPNPPPIIIISGHVDGPERDSLLHMGMSMVLSKPVDAEELLAALQRIVRQKRDTSGAA
ncbi:ATP-binding protein [Hydrogenophaga sp. 5NK40-0174]|uniref:ATP-binding protein n=1 Tax=Hydrogenophaga sp. 5NK40-0174 TaxID=3127649 RepID=UPI003107FF0F